MKRRVSTKPIDGLTPVSKVPAADRFTAANCPRGACRSDDTHTYATRGDSEFKIRYCKCRKCGHTWTDARKVTT